MVTQMLPPIAALVVMGVSGSGKTTIAKALAARLKWTFEDGDRFHPASNVEKMQTGHALTDDDRWPWLRAIAAEIDRKRGLGEPVIMACSALKRAYRDILVHGETTTRIVYLRGSSSLISERLAARKGHFMPPSLLESQFATLEEPGPDEHAIVADIDGSIDVVVSRIVTAMENVKI